MTALKIRKIGNSLGVVLPKEVVASLRVADGDSVYLTESPSGVQLTPYSPEFAAAMDAFEITRKKYRNALKELAK